MNHRIIHNVELNATQKSIIDLLSENVQMSGTELAERIGISKRMALPEPDIGKFYLNIFSWLLRSAMEQNIQVFMTSHSKEAIGKVLRLSEELQQHINLYTLYKY